MPLSRRKFFQISITASAVLATPSAFAHALPNSTLVFIEYKDGLKIELEMPLQELRNASAIFASDSIEADISTVLKNYLETHFRILSQTGALLPWTLLGAEKSKKRDDHVGTYETILARLSLLPSGEFALAEFTVATDVIMHQVPNHGLILQWQDADGQKQDLGFIRFDVLRKVVSSQVVRKPLSASCCSPP